MAPSFVWSWMCGERGFLQLPLVTTTKRGLEEEEPGSEWWDLCHPRATNGHKSVRRLAKKLSEVDLVV